MEETIVKAVKAMCDRLANYHWSPSHPSTYVIDAGGGKIKGVGLIATRDYGAFNLAWGSCEGKWKTDTDQMNLVKEFTKFQTYTRHTVNDVPLGDWLCLLRPKAFHGLLVGQNKLHVDMVDTMKVAAQKAMALE